MKKITLPITIIAFILFNYNAVAQQLELVKDINTTINTESFSNLGRYSINIEDNIIFTAGESVYGIELWVSDGTTDGTHLIKDITPGSQNTVFRSIFKIPSNNVAHFLVDTNGSLELWKTNGTEAGTTKIKDLELSSISGEMVLLNNKYYFLAISNTNEKEIWVTDGTESGTYKFSTGIVFNDLSSIRVFNNQLTGIYMGSGNDIRLFLSDGTISGSSTVDIDDGIILSSSLNTFLGNQIIYSRLGDANVIDREVYSYNYETHTNTMLANINTVGSSSAYGFIAFNGYVYFNATNANGDKFVYKTDGTPSGTNQFTNTSNSPLIGQNIYETNQHLYFDTNISGQHYLNALDGDTLETLAISNTYFGMYQNNGTLYINSINAIYTTDGTSTGTTLLSTDINGNFFGFTASNDILCGSSSNGVSAIWLCDATTGDAVEIKNAGTSTQDANLNNMEVLDNGTLMFSIYNQESSMRELWKSDGSEAGTVMLTETGSIIATSTLNGNLAYIVKTDTDYELWKSDGTAPGTQLVKVLTGISTSINYNASNIVEVNGMLYFTLARQNDTSFLWQTDLTETGTNAVDNSLIFSLATELFVHTDGYIYFAGYEATTGSELWRTDGTLANTLLVKDLRSGSNSSGPIYFASAGNILVFSATSGSGREPHSSDGTDAGTHIIEDLFSYSSGDTSSNPRYLTTFNNEVYFQAKNNDNSERLYKTDGNTVTLIDDLIPNGIHVPNFPAIEYNGYLYFESDPYGTSYNTWLYRTDGTTTEAIGDVEYIEDFAKVADKLFMSTPNGLFLIDETTITTISLANGFNYLTPVNNRLYLTYSDTDVGRELFKIDLCNSSNIVYVNVNATGNNTGYTWNDAFQSLEDAILDAKNCGISEIYVAKGTYKPSISNQADSFTIPEGVSLLGGFNGTETTPDERNWAENPTILSGDLNNNEIADAGDSHTIITALQDNITLDGFIIQYGYADDDTDNSQVAIGRAGAGIYARDAENLNINNCIFNNNIAYGNGADNGVGGAMINFGNATTTTITNSLFFNNTATAGGGAISGESGNISIINCTIANNNASQGGGMHLYASNITATNSLFTNNSGTNGNINVGGPGTATASYNLFYNTTSGNSGDIPLNVIDGGNNIENTDPIYNSIDNIDGYKIIANSPAIDAGDDSVVNLTKDLGGNQRILDAAVDMGAYEFVLTLFTETTTTLPNLKDTSIAWGDYNNDGFLDLLMTGHIGSGSVARIYKNNGDGTFSRLFNPLSPGEFTGIQTPVATWGDLDNDGDLDILVAGKKSSDFSPKFNIYLNNNDETFTELTTHNIPGVMDASLALGDYDNDGDLDILLSGDTTSSNGGEITKVYTNNGNAIFNEETAATLPVLLEGLNSWEDFNNDGYLDILLVGNTTVTSGGGVSKIYINNHDGSFSELTTANFIGLDYKVAFDCADFNNDGNIDIVLAGFSGSSRLCKIYTNNGDGSFTELSNPVDGTSALPQASHASLVWGDYNNDGNIDLLFAGSATGLGLISQIYTNNGDNTFSKLDVDLQGVYESSFAWGDYDNDGDLDLVATGKETTTGPLDEGQFTALYENNSITNTAIAANTIPVTPTNLSSVINDNQTISISWDTASDAETPSAGLSYNILIKENPIGNPEYVKSPMSQESDGWRKVAQLGNTMQNNNFTWNIPDTYIGQNTEFAVKVQTIDNAFAGSPFSDAHIINLNTLSTENQSINQFSIYPNPVNNILNIKTTGQEYNYSLYNIQGQEILKANNQTSKTIDVSKLPSGVYMLKLSSDNNSQSFKIIKQ